MSYFDDAAIIRAIRTMHRKKKKRINGHVYRIKDDSHIRYEYDTNSDMYLLNKRKAKLHKKQYKPTKG